MRSINRKSKILLMVALVQPVDIMLIPLVLMLGSTPALAGPTGHVDPATLITPRYTVQGDAFVAHNGPWFNNRPLYMNQLRGVVLAGDRPFLRFGNGSMGTSSFMLALARNGHVRWVHECSDIISTYRPGRMEWVIKDPAFGTTCVTLEAVPLAEGPGMSVRARIEGAQPGDRLIWACGGTRPMTKEPFLNAWDVTTQGRDRLLRSSFQPEDCTGNRVNLEHGRFVLIPPPGKARTVTLGICDAASSMTVADAAAWRDPVALTSSKGANAPLVCGTIALDKTAEACWTIQEFKAGMKAAAVNFPAPAEAFAAGMRRAEEIGRRVAVDTPDPWLNATVAAANAVMDGIYRDGIHTHAGMRWGVPLIGWRSLYGPTVHGWHDRVKAEAAYCLARQIKESAKTRPHADPAAGLASQADDSRMFGKGRVDAYHPHHYDMQTQFFDGLIHAWHWTGDPELEKILRPALELHLEYLRECFDPDDDGCYESYVNSWPTDNQWYNGGGTSEETAYAYAAHQAALEMARHAGDAAAVARHTTQLEKIRKGFFEKLWIKAKGHPGAYLEQTGLRRLHESPWLYGIFVPIDAGLLSPEQAVQALHYTEYALERERIPYGGEQCWPSNWVPSIWSVRQIWSGDNYHLALAYFQTGLAEEGWKLLRGTFPQQAVFGPVPGDLGHPAGGTDFTDCASMFSRTVVEGLFGYAPNYPRGLVRLAPQFPASWNNALLKTPDVRLDYSRTGAAIRLRAELTQPAAFEIRLPLPGRKIARVSVNGQAAKYDLLAGMGQSVVCVHVAHGRSAAVEVSAVEPAMPAEASFVDAIAGGQATLKLEGAISEFHDPQGVLTGAVLRDGVITGTWTRNAGNHLLLALTRTGDAPQWREFKIKLADPRAEAEHAIKAVGAIPQGARWECLDLKPSLNGDIRTIFQQQYLAPRPDTCSARLGTDGYSTWQTKNAAPKIDLSGVAALLDAPRRLKTTQGVPFNWPGGERNIAFTSQWDNWPRSVTVPVGKTGEALWMLVCGSTNPMQVRIANAALHLRYADGVVETLELTPPFNFWSLCPSVGRVDYDYKRDAFSLPKTLPATVQLGQNCRAVMLTQRLRPGVKLESVTFETLSPEVIIGLMGLTLMNPEMPQHVWEVAKARPTAAGAPRYSDVSMRSLEPHPRNEQDPYDTLRAARELHLTRLEWVYALNRNFVRRAKALGLTVGGALSSALPDAQAILTDLIVGDELWFYFGAWSGLSRRKDAEYVMAGGSVGLATLRRDGFASLDAGEKEGTLTTRPVIFSGKYPFVNFATSGGELRAEILDLDGKPLAPFTIENSVPVEADSTKTRLAWKGALDVSAFSGKPVHFRFTVRNGQLYSFWVTPSVHGASYGYVAAGGPGFSGPLDK